MDLMSTFTKIPNPVLSPVENGGASRGKMAALGIEGLNGVAPGKPGNGIG